MAISHLRAKRKASGARYKKITKKLRYSGSLPTLTGIAKSRKTSLRIKGGNKKQRLLAVDIANVYDPKAKKYFKSKIENVIESPSNRNFVRRNIITKGTVIKTEKGNAKITSRPGQEGTVNAILV